MAGPVLAERPLNIRYRKLSNPTQDIRLMEIQQARRLEDPIFCRLITVPLKKCNFDIFGLSSLIGDPQVTENIYIDGRSATITAHQAEGLRYARSNFLSRPKQRRRWLSEEPLRGPAQRPRLPQRLRNLLRLTGPCLYVWLDSVCINSRNEDEANLLRETMKLVYESAKIVLGWLGPKIETTDAGLRCFSDIDEHMPRWWGDPGDKELYPDNYAPRHEWAKNIRNLWEDTGDGLLPFQKPHWVGANDFMQRPYFQRQWILQEVFMANCPAFMIGDSVVAWTTILRLNRCLEEFKDNESEQFPAHLRAMIAQLPLGTVYELLEELKRRQQWPRSIGVSEGADGIYPNSNNPVAVVESKGLHPGWSAKV